jgi:hypothetical protein
MADQTVGGEGDGGDHSRKHQEDNSLSKGWHPNRTSFTKGVSGNPSGRPKGSRNRKTVLSDVTNVKVSVRENGKQVRKSKYELSLTQLANKAAGGDLKAVAMLNDLMLKHGLTGPDVAGATLPQLGPDDEVVMADIIRRIRQADPATGDLSVSTGEQSNPPPNPEPDKEQDP